MTESKLLGDLAGVSIEAGVSAFTGEAFLIIRATRPDGAELYGQLDPATVRTMALQWHGDHVDAKAGEEQGRRNRSLDGYGPRPTTPAARLPRLPEELR